MERHSLKPVWRLLAFGFAVAAFALLWIRQGHSLLRTQSSSPGNEEGAIPWLHDEAEALSQAKTKKLPIVIDFAADWCGPCQELDAEVFHHPEVEKRMHAVVPLRLDVTDDTEENSAKLRKYGVMVLPSVIFINAEGNILQSPRITGEVSAESFLEALDALQQP